MRRSSLLIMLVCMVFSANALADIKVYDVNPSYVDEVYDVLQNVIRPGPDNPNPLVQLLPSGQILVNTTPELHQQVVAVLDAIGDADPTPRVRLQYWVLLGTDEAAGAEATPDVLDDVIRELRQAHGPLSFRLLGNASLVTDSGMDGAAQGDLTVRQTAYVQGTKLHAELMISFSYFVTTGQYQVESDEGQVNPFQTREGKRQGLELNTSMEQGEFLVVGENSVNDNIDGRGQVDGTLFYIVHWPAGD